MARIHRTSLAIPSIYYDQETLTRGLIAYWGEEKTRSHVVHRLHNNMQVDGRHMAYPIDNYIAMDTFKKRNDAYIESALKLGAEALRTVFDGSGLKPSDLNAMLFTTVTGLAVPSIDARLMNRLEFSPQLKRMPLFGLGCLAGAAGVSRAADYLKGHPTEAAVLLAIEICSLTLQKNDVSISNYVASGLFGDGASAVLMLGNEHPLAKQSRGPRIINTRSTFFANTEDVMGWDFSGDGFKIILSADVPSIAKARLRACVEDLLAPCNLALSDIKTWIAHPGGPKVIDAMEKGLSLEAGTLDKSRNSLKKLGNLSSASVLAILHDTLHNEPISPGGYGIMLAMGPGFCAEVILLQW